MPDLLRDANVVFLALPHGVTMNTLPHWARLAPTIVDLSADYRLHDPADYETFYGIQHTNAEWLARFVPGIPEINRARLRNARYIAVPGCMANAAIRSGVSMISTTIGTSSERCSTFTE